MKGDNFCGFLFASLGDNFLPKRGVHVEERICSFPLKVDSTEKAGSFNKTCHRDRIARLTAPCPSHKKL